MQEMTTHDSALTDINQHETITKVGDADGGGDDGAGAGTSLHDLWWLWLGIILLAVAFIFGAGWYIKKTLTT